MNNTTNKTDVDVDVDIDIESNKKEDDQPVNKEKNPAGEQINDAKPFTPIQLLIIVLFIVIWTADGVLIHSIREVDYERASVTLTIEIVKFVIASIIYFYANDGSLKEAVGYANRGVYFAGTGFIYCIYNLIRFWSLTVADPGTYRILINIRIVFSGILFQLLFKQSLGLRKWISLFVLVIGCAIIKWGSFSLSIPLFIIISVQAFFSSAGGVYSEFFLKKDFEVNINLQNMYLYVFSITFTILTIGITNTPALFDLAYLFRNWELTMIPIVLIGALAGFMTGLMLKHLNVITKEFANGGEMLLGVISASLLFGVPMSLTIVLSFVVVTLSVWGFYWEKFR